MLFSVLLSAAFGAAAYAQTSALNLVYQFPNTSYTNIENVAVRSSNGQLLLNLATGARMVQLDPSAADPQPVPVVTLSGPGSLTGIAETSPDVFTVAAGNFSFGPTVPGGFAGRPGTFSVWSVDLTGPQAVATQIVAIPEASALNGLTTVKGNPDVVLIADSGLGAVWSVNIKTGAYKIVIQDAQFLPTAALSLGINGIHTKKNVLYWTNSALGTFGSVPINADGSAAGAIVAIAHAVDSTKFDDFALDRRGNAWVAAQPNALYQVQTNGAVVLVAGGGNDTTLISPTSAVFKGCTLYVVTGGAGGPAPQSGQVFSLDTCSAAYGGGNGYGGGWKAWTA